MDRDTFTETVRAFGNRNPFRPFTVATVSGNRYEVDYPDAVSVRDGLALFAGPGGTPVIFDHGSVHDLSGRGAETA